MPMQHLSFSDKVDMILIFGECQENAMQAAELYAQRYPDRLQPDRRTFKRIVEKLRETGSLKPKKKTVINPAVTHEINQAIVLNIAENNPQVSSREMKQSSGISKSSILRILKKHKFHAYHIELHQELHGEDFMNRVRFCTWAQEKLQENQDFFKFVLFTDECTFKSNGHVNRHNMHYWSVVNPHWMREEKTQDIWSLNVWGGIIDNRLVGPFFFEGHLTGAMYAEFLRNSLDDLLEDVPLNVIQNLWFQQDGAPPHFSREARGVADEKFPDKWIGRGGPIAWPARSPDLTPMDFFTWGVVQEIVYRTQPTTRQDMQQRLVDAFQTINERNTAATVQNSFQRRAQMCIEREGHHFEQYL